MSDENLGARFLSGEVCRLNQIVDVTSIITKDNIDVIKTAVELRKALDKYEIMFEEINKKLQLLESKGATATTVKGVDKYDTMFSEINNKLQELEVKASIPAATGPRGPSGMVYKELQQIPNVDTTNVEEGSILVARFAKDGSYKWVAETTE